MRQDAFTEEARRYGIPNPKGVLLVGIQGTGKSLSAKTIAYQWRLPLLRLDVGRLFGGIVGESENRIRQMIQLAEAISPCVLWMDEIDKAFGNINSGVDGDSGTSRRVFAAALGYAVKRPGKLILVVDFGGGTLDLSLVKTVNNSHENNSLRAEVLAKSEAYVGGEDIDVWIVDDYLHSQNLTPEQVGKIGYQNLLEIAERLKIQLSKNQSVAESWFDDESFMSYELKINREKLEEILEYRQFLQQLRDTLDEVLASALRKGISKNDIEQVLLVGGSCLIPAVQQLIISYFGKNKVKLDKPFDAVCHGALAITQITEINDFLRHSYAIRLWENYSKSYIYHRLFTKGEKYPCQRQEWLNLQVANNGQKEIRLDIGELGDMSQTEIAFDASGRMTSSTLQHQESYRSLDNQNQQVCVAKLNPLGEAGMDRISVLFEVDSRRILLATVKDLLTGKVLINRGEIYKLT